MKTLNVIGAGHVGKVLARLFAQHKVFRIGQVLNQSAASTRAAVKFIGAGEVAGGYEDLRNADLTMIAVPDDQIAACSADLARLGRLQPGGIVFHCSGALPASVLAGPAAADVAIASVHPVRSFADPAKVAKTFSGTFCGLEGSESALECLQLALTAIGARTLIISAQNKTLYHAASVLACNYLVTLMDLAQRTYVAAGIAPELAGQLAEPLVREAIDNVFRLGPAAALTGPIARGDLATVARQQAAIDGWDEQAGQVYEVLAQATMKLAAARKA